jgi:hypothetical protein
MWQLEALCDALRHLQSPAMQIKDMAGDPLRNCNTADAMASFQKVRSQPFVYSGASQPLSLSTS